jgi:CubicO group peptidase (beta-lactamase class C family)
MITTVEPESVGMSSARLARIRPLMQSYVDQKGFSGISTLISRRGKIVHAEQVGPLRPDEATPLTQDAIFRVYSMTKPIIATALMLLYERARFRLTDPVALYLPAFAQTRVLQRDGTLADVNPARPLQVRDLLSHTSGMSYDHLTDYPIGELYRQARLMNDASRTLAELTRVLAGLPLAFQPGSAWHYSLGLDVAAHLIEVLADEPLGDFLQRELFAPLGMVDTGFGVAAAQRHRLAGMRGSPDLFGPGATFQRLLQAYRGGHNYPIDVETTYPSDRPQQFQRGGIGLFSTLHDYWRFAQLLADGGELDGVRLLSRKTLELMHRNHLPADLMPFIMRGVPNYGWGFGLGSRVLLDPAAAGGHGSVGSFGWTGAAKTLFWVDPVEQLVGVFLTQYMIAFDFPDQDFWTLTYQALT